MAQKNAIAVKSAHPTGSLADIRSQIADLQAKIAEVEAAPLPLDFIEDAFRRSFGDLIAPKNDVLTRLASGFAHSTDRVPSPVLAQRKQKQLQSWRSPWPSIKPATCSFNRHASKRKSTT